MMEDLKEKGIDENKIHYFDLEDLAIYRQGGRVPLGQGVSGAAAMPCSLVHYHDNPIVPKMLEAFLKEH